MKYFLLLPLFGLTLTLAKAQNQDLRSVQIPSKASQAFRNDLIDLQDYFSIPGISAVVQQGDSILLEHYNGFANLEKEVAVGPKTLFPIASLTKIFSGIMVLKLVEEGKLSLDDPINAYVPHAGLGDSVLIRHILSHTSQGMVGEHFYYSWRFGYLTAVIESASGMPFEAYLQELILDPLHMTETYIMDEDSSPAYLRSTLASPYVLYGEANVERGNIEWGFSASAGLASNATDLLKLSEALDRNSLISANSKSLMYSPPREGLPYGHGIFCTDADVTIYWGYGQYDAYASLFLKIPEKDLTLILLANNNLMSDHARLINGDPLSSLFVLSFLQHYLLKESPVPIIAQQGTQNSPAPLNPVIWDAQAQAAAFMGRYDTAQYSLSQYLLEQRFRAYPVHTNPVNLNLLFTLTFLKDIAFYRELGPMDKFDGDIEAIAKRLLDKDPNNPYARIYLASYFDRKGQEEMARTHFQAIADMPNLASFWYTREAQNWLNSHP